MLPPRDPIVGRGWARRYPPLAAIVLALSLAVFALPSALNLPQANPSQTLEYAPVPGDSHTSQAGNFAGLGLGSGGAAGSVGVGANQPPDLLAGGALPPPGGGNEPRTKSCVGNPPRQS